MPNILYIVPHRLHRSPGQRFRCEQYLAALKEAGFSYTYSNIIYEKYDQIFYSKGHYILKFWIVCLSIFQRLRDVRRAANYDVVFIYREAFMLGSVFFEKQLRKRCRKLVFDFDDAIWMNDTSQGNRNLAWMKKPEKTASIIKLADLVFAGNIFLAEYAQRYNTNVRIVPTTIDMQYHRKKQEVNKQESLCIGWTGTSTTLKHFETIVPVLEKVSAMYKERVYFKIIVNIPFHHPSLNLKVTPWNISTEIDDLSEFDIGIMPLPDDDWAKGKCGFKGLQYMSLGIPTIMSPVGVNKEIIAEGENGFLASTDEEWIQKLSWLIESKVLRNRIGNAGRITVEEKYSVNAIKDKYVRYFTELVNA